MGTKLGNLHILGASVDEVAPLLPGATVGQWSERFVSAYSEEYQLGSAEMEGKKLSRKLPGATVLSAAIFDSDVVSFEVYQAGKQLTAHLLNPYEDINKLGDPKVFCEALGLPAEDEKRLKVIWKKGDAEEQMELTAALLGAPLYFDPEFLPKEPVLRDIGKVDAWIAERPDPPKPPKVKNATTAVCLQEVSGLYVNSKRYANGRLQLSCYPFGPHNYPDPHSEEQLWQTGLDDVLAPVSGLTEIHSESEVQSEDKWRFMFKEAGYLVHITSDGHTVTSPNLCSCKAWEWTPDMAKIALSPDGKRVLCICYGQGIWILDSSDLSIIAALPTKEALYGCCVDAYSRFWVKTKGGIRGYDENLRLISNHRIPGDSVTLYLNAKGELCALACSYTKHIFRIYRIS